MVGWPAARQGCLAESIRAGRLGRAPGRPVVCWFCQRSELEADTIPEEPAHPHPTSSPARLDSRELAGPARPELAPTFLVTVSRCWAGAPWRHAGAIAAEIGVLEYGDGATASCRMGITFHHAALVVQMARLCERRSAQTRSNAHAILASGIRKCLSWPKSDRCSSGLDELALVHGRALCEACCCAGTMACSGSHRHCRWHLGPWTSVCHLAV